MNASPAVSGCVVLLGICRMVRAAKLPLMLVVGLSTC